MSDREDMIQRQIEDRGVRSPSVLAAMRNIPREVFVPAELKREAYTDQPLPIGQGQTVSQPYIVALMTEALALEPAHRVLEIGTGSGYQTAILARLATRVYSIERIPALQDEAKLRLEKLGITNVEYLCGDGTLGWAAQAPFDRIIITAAAPGIPRKLLSQQLAEGGVAVVPAGRADWQYLYRITKRKGKLEQEDLGACRFVPLIGAEGWERYSG